MKIYKIYENGVNLPHPRMHKRNFVLIPLFEVNKDWIHPKSKHHIKSLIFSLSKKDISSIKQIWISDIIGNAKFWGINK